MRDPAETILVVEDDRSLREGLVLNFELEGFEVHTAVDGEEGLHKAFDLRPDLIVLDIMLPGINGLEILAELRERQQDVPVLILSARDTTDNKVEGLGLGADDYLTKPFDLPELLARVEVMLRRRRTGADSDPPMIFGDLVIDRVQRRVMLRGDDVELSAREFDILSLLAGSPDRPHTREAILDRVWGWDFDGSPRTVDNFILALRRKLEIEPSQPRHLRTVRGVGYVFHGQW